MDVEEAAERDPSAMRRLPVDIRQGSAPARRRRCWRVSTSTTRSPRRWPASTASSARRDAELVEINPLVLTTEGEVVALDCKFVLDDAALPRQPEIADRGTPDRLTALEAEAAEAGLKYIELGGSVGVLANGAGLTMTTMDAITHFGGAPANFLEIGGEAYTKSKTALSILLKNPNIRSLLVNFCGAFARTDVMAEGVVTAWKELNPGIPVFFTIHGTGEDEAVDLVRRELGIEPFDLMDDAVRAAVEAAR